MLAKSTPEAEAGGGPERARTPPVETGKSSRRQGAGLRRQQKSCHHLRCHHGQRGGSSSKSR
eukprot:1583949-Prorocentrum_lima.AAC.1